MKTWLMSVWEELRANFWFVPSLMVAGAIALSLATINMDKAGAATHWISTLGWTFARGAEGSRALLSTVAGSMMTITSVTFSITIVALQLASSQFGPRLLRNFMRDRGNQFALGTFLATFTYCLLILRTVNGTSQDSFVPHFSVSVGLLLAMMSLGVFIFFIHHAATSIQAEQVITNVAIELHESIERLFERRDQRGSSFPDRQPIQAEIPGRLDRESSPVTSISSGYIQAIDLDRLIALASEHDLVIEVPYRAGKYLVEGCALAKVWPIDQLDDKLATAVRNAFYLGSRRTLTQDVEFAIDQLVEVAVRALSPGVNDPFTAINCVDRLGSALAGLCEREFPPRQRGDDQGRLRVITDVITIGGVVDSAFNQIRQASRSDAAVTIRLLETIALVAERAGDSDFREALRHHAELIHRGSREGLPDPDDRREADLRYWRAIERLGFETLAPIPD